MGITITIEFVRNPEYEYEPDKELYGNDMKMYEAISKYIELHNGYYLTDDRVEDHIDLMKLFRTIADEI
jgi:hypothetical protein